MSYIVILMSFTAIFPSIGYDLTSKFSYIPSRNLKDIASHISSIINSGADCWKIYRTMGNSSYRLNFDLGKKKKIHHHS
jgi:hypothetical protein